MAVERVPMTQEGHEKKKAQFDEMNREMLDVTKRLAEARDEGDLKENAEYHALRERQGELQARIDDLRDQLSRAQILDPSKLETDAVVFGARVKVKDLDLDEEETFELVGPGDEDPDENRILTSSPIGQGLLGKKRGETAEIEAPAGTIRFEIIEISHV